MILIWRPSARARRFSIVPWLNGTYIREMEIERLRRLCRPYLEGAYDISAYPDDALKELVDSIRGKMVVLSDCLEQAGPYFRPIDELLTEEALAYLKSNPASRAVLLAFADELRKRDSVEAEDIGAIGKVIQKTAGAKGKDLYMPIRVGVTGRLHGPELAKAIPLLGKDKCLERVERVLERL